MDESINYKKQNPKEFKNLVNLDFEDRNKIIETIVNHNDILGVSQNQILLIEKALTMHRIHTQILYTGFGLEPKYNEIFHLTTSPHLNNRKDN